MEPFVKTFLFLIQIFWLKNSNGVSYFGPGTSNNGDCFKDFAYLQQRFNFEQLNFFCQQWRAYNELISIDNSSAGLNPFTTNQRKYLDSLKIDLNITFLPYPISVRKEIRSMTEDERLLFQVAVRSLKWDKIDGVSKYDLLVTLHHPALAPGAYVGAAFLPWHREYLRTFETALKQVNAYVTLPYWDTTLDNVLPNPTSSVLWTDLFLGDGEGVVDNGPFSGWTFLDNETSSPLNRNLSGAGRLMNQDDVDFILRQPHFRQFSACVDLRLEQTSRYVHEWVGGCMMNLYYSPQDPVFFLYHAFVDYLWEEWRHNRTFQERVYGYPPNYEACTKFHYAGSPMSPFEPLKNVDGFNEVYTRHYYVYQTRPTCSSQFPNACASSYLFCNINESKCVSKIMDGGNCSGFIINGNMNPCYQSKCINGKCTVTGPGDLDGGLNVSHFGNRTGNALGKLFRDLDLTTNSTLIRNLAKNIASRKHNSTQSVLGSNRKSGTS